MKKLLIAALVLLIAGAALAQDRTDVVEATAAYAKDSLKTTGADSVAVSFKSPERFKRYVISLYSTGSDTITVWTKDRSNSYYLQRGLVDQLTGVMSSSVVATATKKEYFITDAQPVSILVTTTDQSFATYFTVGGKAGDAEIGTPQTQSMALFAVAELKVTLTRPTNATQLTTPYTAGDMVMNTDSLSLAIPNAVLANGGSSLIQQVYAEIDTPLAGAGILVGVAKDTAGFGKVADNAPNVSTSTVQLDSNRVGEIYLITTTDGNGSGSTRAWAQQNYVGILFTAATNSRTMFLRLKAFTAWQGKVSGTIKLTFRVLQYY